MITLEDLKARLGIDPGDNTYDVYLQAQIDAASEMIRQYCGRPFAVDDVTDQWRLDHGWYPWWKGLWRPPHADGHIMVSRPPINTLTSITVAGEALTVDQDYYVSNAAAGMIRLQTRHMPMPFSIDPTATMDVAYNGGMAPPASVQEVCYDICSSRYYNRDNDPASGPLRSKSIPEVIRLTYDTRLGGGRALSADALGTQYGGVLDYYRLETVLV